MSDKVRDHLRSLMLENFQVANLKGITPKKFEKTLRDRIDKIDKKSENYKDTSKQRDLSIRYFWGHQHDFGSFSLSGLMGERHLDIITTFIADFDLPLDLTGKKVLDIGVWTGGTSILFAAMGAEVVAFEEVKMYANTVTFLADSFGISNKLRCETTSLYSMDIHDEFDYVIYSGVIYHVTDPILSLRILYNALKDDGKIFVETFGVAAADNLSPLCVVEGGATSVCTDDAKGFNRSGWNYFIPTESALKKWMETVGFKDSVMTTITERRRIHARATRLKHEDFLRAGLSRPDIR